MPRNETAERWRHARKRQRKVAVSLVTAFLLSACRAALSGDESPVLEPVAVEPAAGAATPPADGQPPAAAAEQPASPAVPPPALPAAREPAADGTVSVVIDPSRSSGSAAPSQDSVQRNAAPQPPAVPARVTPPLEQPAADVATALLGRVLEPLDEQAVAGGSGREAAGLYARPLPLLEALERSGDRSRRLWITHAYWKTSVSFAGLRWAIESADRLGLVAPGGDPHDRAALDVAMAAAAADLADARAELVAAQQELVDLVRMPTGDPPPWPVDRPLAGPYQTHFEAIFATRAATGRIRAIDRMLPSRHAALESRAAAVLAAEKALEMAEADHAKGRRPIESVIAAHAALAGQQRGFLAGARAYNLDIAEYVMAVADLSVPDDRFVSMLIGTPIRWRPAGPPANLPVQPATRQPADAILP